VILRIAERRKLKLLVESDKNKFFFQSAPHSM
jgi:hypothetical protein